MEETNNNLEEAKNWLKKRGFKDAENRMARTANTKLFGLKENDNKVVVANLSCETDFVACTDMFRNFLNVLIDNLSESKLNKISNEDLDKIKVIDNKYETAYNNATLLESLKYLISKTQENCKINLCEKFDYSNGLIGSYLHSSPEGHPKLGQKAAVVVLESPNGRVPKELKDFADNLAMQVVALNPKYLNISDIPQDVVEKEKKILKETIIAEGKVKEDQIEKVLLNKLNSWYEEVVLNEQIFVIVDYESTEGKNKISALVSKKGKALGIENLKIKEFKLFI